MRGTSTEDDSFNEGLTSGAGMSGLPIDSDLVLVATGLTVSIGVSTIGEGCPATSDSLVKYSADRVIEVLLLGRSQGICPAQRMKPRRKKRLVGIDIAQASQELLIQQERLEPARAALKDLAEPLQGKRIRQRFRAQIRGDFGYLPDQIDTPELAHILETQLHAVIQTKGHVNMLVWRLVGRNHAEPSAHLEVDQEVPRI
jgi:hypothetical protein